MTLTTPYVREAGHADLAAILALFAADELASRPPLPAAATSAASALDDILHDPNNFFYVAELEGSVVGMFQLTFIRQLSFGGCVVAQIESVCVAPQLRSRGIGTAMLEFALAESRRRGAIRLQLTSNAARADAHRFYERLGFSASHKGMKLYLA